MASPSFLPDRIERAKVESPVSESKAWVDPFVGFRARCQLWDHGYVVARGDIGGFGVSSDLTWNAFGALGMDLNERTSVEIGSRYLSVDYQSGGFHYDVATRGPYIGVNIGF